jgi:cytochrome c oxidase subunit II
MIKSERAWMTFGLGTLIVFLVVMAVAALHDDVMPPSHVQVIDPTKVAETPPFDKPGLHQTGRNRYDDYVVAHIFAFEPSSIKVPVGSTVTFYATSPDVVHGFFIPNTAINMMVIPGWVSEDSHTFRKAGTYLLLCNEYCGAGHHFMYGSIEVQ